jgi:hypothetical protein
MTRKKAPKQHWMITNVVSKDNGDVFAFCHETDTQEPAYIPRPVCAAENIDADDIGVTFWAYARNPPAHREEDGAVQIMSPIDWDEDEDDPVREAVNEVRAALSRLCQQLEKEARRG